MNDLALDRAEIGQCLRITATGEIVTIKKKWKMGIGTETKSFIGASELEFIEEDKTCNTNQRDL